MNNSSLTYVPNPILKQKTKKVTVFNYELRTLASSMTDLMRANRGVGLAANQINSDQRLIVVEYEPETKDDPTIPLTVLVNPTITDTGRETDIVDEGCLSIPYVELPIKRPIKINVLATDLDGKRIKIKAQDIFARILQHEIDHLNGVLITDRAFPDLTSLAGLRIAFFGSPDHANAYLTALAATPAAIVGVVTETDKPAGRSQLITSPPVKTHSELLGLPVYQFDNLRQPETVDLLRKLKPDLAIVVAYGQIIPQVLLDIPKLGFLNIHYSLLPELRGPSPHQTAILTGQKETGTTIFKLDKGLDTGPIISQKRLKIEPTDTSLSLLHRLIPLSVGQLLEVLPGYVRGQRPAKPQISDHTVTRSHLFTKTEAKIDWSADIEQIDRQIRAFAGWPIAYTEVDNQRLLIHLSHLIDNTLVLDVVQPAGKKPMTFRDYLNGNPNGLTFFRDLGKIKLD